MFVETLLVCLATETKLETCEECKYHLQIFFSKNTYEDEESDDYEYALKSTRYCFNGKPKVSCDYLL